MTPSEIDNAIRWKPGDRGGHVESHFMKATAPSADRALWVRHTIFAPLGRPDLAVAEVWAIAFDRRQGSAAKIAAAKSTRPLVDARLSSEPFRIVSAGSTLETGHARGEIGGGPHTLKWDLAFEPRGPSFHPFPSERMYNAPLPKSKLLTPYPDTRFDGEMIVDGERWDVSGWAGMQGHNWGRQNAERYAWVHCNQWEDAPAGTWFEGFSGRVRIGPVLVPWLSVAAIQLEDQMFRFDGARAMTSRKIEFGYYRWHFEVEHRGAKLEGTFEAAPSDLAGLRYENPDASITYCLNSKLATGTLRLTCPGRPALDLRTRAAALELATKDPRHGITLLV